MELPFDRNVDVSEGVECEVDESLESVLPEVVLETLQQSRVAREDRHSL